MAVMFAFALLTATAGATGYISGSLSTNTSSSSSSTCMSYDNMTTNHTNIIKTPPILYTIQSYPRMSICESTWCHLSPYFQLLECDAAKQSICFIYCEYNGETSPNTNCYHYKWYLQETQYVTSIIINCELPRSCFGLEVNVFDSEYDIKINSISILCESCQSMEINFDRYENEALATYQQHREFNVYCLTDTACKWMNIAQYLLPNSSWNDTSFDDYTAINVYCMQTASCRYADISYFNHVILNLYMFGGTVLFSNGITVMVMDYDSVIVHCGNEEDLRWFKYHKSHLRDMYDLWEDTLIEYELPYDHTLPCDDITIYSLAKKCKMQYVLNDYYDFVKMIASEKECYWINTDFLYVPKCVDIEQPLYDHTITMQYTLNMNFNSAQQCQQYFGIESTSNTEKNIAGIFFAVLFEWISKNNQNYIKNIKRVPLEQSVSIDYDCDNFKVDKYDVITAWFYVESTVENATALQPLLTTYSEFYNNSRDLFHTYFNGLINLGVEGNPNTKKQPWYENMLIWYSLVAIAGASCLFFIVCVTCLSKYSYYKGFNRIIYDEDPHCEIDGGYGHDDYDHDESTAFNHDESTAFNHDDDDDNDINVIA